MTLTSSIPSGQIVFGAGFQSGKVIDVASHFGHPARIFWTAYLSKPVNGHKPARVTFTRESGPGTFPRLAWSYAVSLKRAVEVQGSISAGDIKLHLLQSQHAGQGAKFSLDYATGGKTLAGGVFYLNGSSGSSSAGY